MGIFSKLRGGKPSTHLSIWKQLGPTILARPQQSLAALLGDVPAQQALQAAKLQVPSWALLRQDPLLDPNPHGLDLEAEFLDSALFVRSLALWGPRALERAAFACAEVQMARQTRCDAEVRPLRDAAFEAARAHLLQLGPNTREQARLAAFACFESYEPFEEDPDDERSRERWCQLGAPWFAAQTASDAAEFTQWDGDPPRSASITWGNRNAVWPSRAADAAAEWSSLAEVQSAMRNALLAWALSDTARPGEFA